MSLVTSRPQSFISPPLDLPVEFCLDFHHERNSGHPAFVFTSLNEESNQLYTYADFVPAVHRAGLLVSEQLQLSLGGCSPPVVAIIVRTDLLTYITTLLGVMRAGMTAFPISYRMSSNVIAHLLVRCHPAAIIFDPSTESLVFEANSIYVNGVHDHPLLLKLPALSSLYPGHNEHIPLPMHSRRAEDASILIHSSSSSSGFPNIAAWSNLAISHYTRVQEMPYQDLCGKILRGCRLELFHSLTICLVFMVVRRGLIMSLPNPWTDSHTAVANDFTEVFRSIELIKPHFILTNPRVIEAWAKSSTQIDILRTCGANIYYGGSFLNRSIGNRLVASGVRLCTSYGSTEMGPISIFSHFQGEDWEYFTVKPRPDVIFTPREDSLFELVVAPRTGEISYLAAFNTTWQGRDAYNPGDLFIAHPTKPHTYKMFGRLSDLILLSNGETLNPVEFESELARSPLVASAVTFGHRQPRVGVIIEPVQGFMVFGDSKDPRDNFRNAIWPAVEEANAKVISNHRISKTMIIVTQESKPISVSLKGLPRRALVWQQYQDEIHALYRE